MPGKAITEWKIITCPVAGKKNAVQIVEMELLPALKEAGISAEMILTERKGHATELAKQHGSETCGLIAVGGDGTIHEVMDGLLQDKKLGNVPIGLLSQGDLVVFVL
jgi:diacylglycerol kinase family enzyme